MGHTTTKEKHPLLVCNWPHSVGQNHFFVMMLLNRNSLFRVLPEDSAQFTSQKIWFPASRPDDVTYRPDAHLSKASSVWTFLCVEKLRTAPACIRPDVSAARLDATQCLTSYEISFQNIVMGRSLQPSERHGFPSGRTHS